MTYRVFDTGANILQSQLVFIFLTLIPEKFD